MFFTGNARGGGGGGRSGQDSLKGTFISTFAREKGRKLAQGYTMKHP